jgi:hypothetical protein
VAEFVPIAVTDVVTTVGGVGAAGDCAFRTCDENTITKTSAPKIMYFFILFC